jgi:hypothetical protein
VAKRIKKKAPCNQVGGDGSPEPDRVQGSIYALEQSSYFINRLGSQRAICGKKNNNAAATTRLIKKG